MRGRQGRLVFLSGGGWRELLALGLLPLALLPLGLLLPSPWRMPVSSGSYSDPPPRLLYKPRALPHVPVAACSWLDTP